MPSVRVMRAQAAAKRVIKSRLFRDGAQPRRIRFGPSAGTCLWLDRQMHLQREFGLYEVETHRYYRSVVPGARVVYDVGAWDGDTTIMFAHLSRQGTVYAFEPTDEGCSRLRANLALNPALRDRVRLMRLAVGTGNGGQQSLDALVESGQILAPDFVKIDVDGVEVDVLQGMQGLLQTTSPALLLETHGLDRERACLALLKEAGYRTEIVPNAWWRTLYPELRPVGHNRWLFAEPVNTSR